VLVQELVGMEAKALDRAQAVAVAQAQALAVAQAPELAVAQAVGMARAAVVLALAQVTILKCMRDWISVGGDFCVKVFGFVFASCMPLSANLMFLQ